MKKTTKKQYKNLINRLSLAKHDRNMMNKILTKKAHNNCPPDVVYPTMRRQLLWGDKSITLMMPIKQRPLITLISNKPI